MKVREWMGIGICISFMLVAICIFGGWWLISHTPWRLPEFDEMGSALCEKLPAQVGNAPDRVINDADKACLGDSMTVDMGVGEVISSAAANAIVDTFLKNLNFTGLEVTETLEFESHFYSIVREKQTSRGAMTLIVDKLHGTVSPEMGPNIMWNTEYGIHSTENGTGDQLTADDALYMAQVWLRSIHPGVQVMESAIPFYGYYAFFTGVDHDIVGVLSVHDTTGQVWYHSWPEPVKVEDGARSP